MYGGLIDFFVDVTFTVAHTVRMFIVSWWNLCRKSQSTCKSSLDSIILPQQNLRCLMKYIRAIFNRIVLSLSHHSPRFYGLLLRRRLHRSARTLPDRDCHNRGTCTYGRWIQALKKDRRIIMKWEWWTHACVTPVSPPIEQGMLHKELSSDVQGDHIPLVSLAEIEWKCLYR